MLDPGVTHRVRVGDVAVHACDVLAAQLPQHCWIEVYDQDFFQEALRLFGRALVLELVEDGARVAEETEEDHRLVQRFCPVLAGRLGSVQVLQADSPEAGGQQSLDRVAEVDHVGRNNRGHRKGDDHDREHVLVDLVQRHAKGRDDDRELAHLRQVDCGHDARPQTEPERVQDRHDDHPADDDERRCGERQAQHLRAGNGDLHA